MAGQGRSATKDEMPAKDNFFAQLDPEDTAEPNLIEPTDGKGTPKIDAVFVQEADRLEQKADVKLPDAEKVEEKSETAELIALAKTQAENINTLVESRTQQPQAVETQKEQPKNLAEYLFGDKAEEFVYDPEEAISDANSDSAKYHRAEIALEARKQIDRAKAEDTEADAQKNFSEEKKALMGEYGMSSVDFDKFEKEASERNVTLKDIYLMIHRDEISKNITKNLANQSSGQRTRMANMSPALSSKGGHEVQKPTDSQYFSKIFGVNNADLETTI